jgi:hypothetical protein
VTPLRGFGTLTLPAKLEEQFAEPAKLEKANRENLATLKLWRLQQMKG